MSEAPLKDRDEEASNPYQHTPYQTHHHVPQQYGTFPVFTSYQQPAMGFPQPIPPPGVPVHPPFLVPSYYPHGYQSGHGYVTVAEGSPLRTPPLPCCGVGIGWLLFVTGFFFAAIPWYVGAFVFLCVRGVDHREKPGYVACTIAAFLSVIAVVVGATKVSDVWS